VSWLEGPAVTGICERGGLGRRGKLREKAFTKVYRSDGRKRKKWERHNDPV